MGASTMPAEPVIANRWNSNNFNVFGRGILEKN